MRKKWLATLLTLAMLLSLVPTAAFAAEPEETVVGVVETTVQEALAEVGVSTYSAGSVELAPGSHERWIDRIANIKTGDYYFAYEFYLALEDAAAESDGGWLAHLSGDSAIQEENFSTDLGGHSTVYKINVGTADLNTAAAYISAAYAAFDRDHPEVFWLSGSANCVMTTSTSGNVIYFVLKNEDGFDIRKTDYQDANEISHNISLRDAAVNTILNDSVTVDSETLRYSDGATDYDKVRYFNAWLTHNNAYNSNVNSAPTDAWECVSALDGRTGPSGPVCEGYARAFQVLCDEAGIPCVLVDGRATNSSGSSEAHMWNYVQMEDGKWYAVDVTWNDPTVSGVSGAVSGHEGELYLLVGSETVVNGQEFLASHPVSNQISNNGLNFTNGPTLESNKYTPPAEMTGLTVTIAGVNSGTDSVPEARGIGRPRKAEFGLGATATYEDGSSTEVPDKDVKWSLSGTTTGVSIDTGETYPDQYLLLVTSEAGSYDHDVTITVTAEYGGETAAATLTLMQKTAQARFIQFSGPKTIQVPTSGSVTEQYTATVYDQYGAEMEVAKASWSISGVGGVSVDTNGVVTVTSGAAAGTATLTATCGGVSETFDISIIRKQAAGVTITGAPSEVVAGSKDFKLNAQIQGDSDPDYNKISWSSSDNSVLDIKNYGTIKVDGSPQAFAGIAVKGPGTATITATYEDEDYYGQDSVTVTVLKKPTLDDFTYTLPGDTVYDATAKEATVAVKGGITGMGSYKILYNGSETAPVDAGTYTVTLQVAKSDTYAAATFDLGTFTIAKATPTITASDLTVTKNTTQALGASISNGGALTYQSSNTRIATVDASGTVTGMAEGTAIITIYYGGSENYSSMTKNVTVTVIDKTLVAVTFADAASQTYTPDGYALGGQFSEATAANTAAGGTITYVYNGTTYETLSALPTVTDAGTYTVTAVYDSATEHGETTASFIINKADQAALTITSTGPATYGVDYTLTTSGGTGTGAVSFEAIGISGDAGRATVTGSTMHPNRAGIVEVIATKAGDNNYNPVTSAPVHITINKADYTGTKTAAGSARYGTTGTVDLSGLIAPDGTAALGTVTDDNSILNGTPTMNGNVLTFAFENRQGDVGKTAEIPVTITSTNYKDYTITVTVTMVDKYVPVLDVMNLYGTYNGQPVPASVITGTATYNGEPVEGTWSWTSEAPTNAGTYTVSVTFTPADTETYISVTSTIMIYISKATPTGAPKYTAINTSGKTLADAGLTTEGSTFSVPGTVAWDDPADTEVKVNTSYQWTFTPTDTDNYKTLTGSIELWHKSSSSGGSGNKTETEKNPDGSTTTTVTKPNGTVTETTKWPNGSQEVIETKKDGTVTTTTTDKTGNKTEVVENPDGSSKTTVDNKDGSSSVTKVDEDGKVEAQVTLPASVVEDADGEIVTLPMPEVRAASDRDEAPVVTVDLPRDTSAKVEIPVRRVTSGTVAILVKADGTEEVIKTSITTDNGVAVTLSDGDTVKIVDNSKTFADVSASYWGSDYIDFVTSREIFSGTGANTFAPDLPMNRAMIVTVLAAYDGADTSSSGGAWYEAGRRWAMANGISDGTNMEQNLTREQLALMLWSYAGKPDANQDLTGYPDMGSVSSWAAQAMAWAVENGLISGVDGALAPQGEATRVQVATILMRFVEKTA